jgi:long-chain acyl-CoA synthetase
MYEKEGKPYPGNEEAIRNPDVRKIIQTHIDAMNRSLAQFESIKKFEMLPRDWTVDSGEMTPKLSLKRKMILEANKTLIGKIYNE